MDGWKQEHALCSLPIPRRDSIFEYPQKCFKQLNIATSVSIQYTQDREVHPQNQPACERTLLHYYRVSK